MVYVSYDRYTGNKCLKYFLSIAKTIILGALSNTTIYNINGIKTISTTLTNYTFCLLMIFLKRLDWII